MEAGGDQEGRKYFETWNAKVIASIPKDRLLIYNFKDGWEPLAKFLNMTPPVGVKFPRYSGQLFVLYLLWCPSYLVFVCFNGRHFT